LIYAIAPAVLSSIYNGTDTSIGAGVCSC